MSRLIHLNGPPGIGKSTIARRCVVDHPGVLNCDIDQLRHLIVEVVLMDTQEASVARSHRRGAGEQGSWHERVRQVVAAQGGDAALECHHQSLVGLASRSWARRIDSAEGGIEETYQAVLRALGERAFEGLLYRHR